MNRCEVYADHRWILTDQGMRCSKCGRAPQEPSTFSVTDYVRSVFRRDRGSGQADAEEPASPEES